jgi:hypothetical protein
MSATGPTPVVPGQKEKVWVAPKRAFRCSGAPGHRRYVCNSTIIAVPGDGRVGLFVANFVEKLTSSSIQKFSGFMSAISYP